MSKSTSCLLLLAGCFWATSNAAHAQTNLAAASAGGRLVFFASQYNDSDWAARNLIDGSPGTGWSGRSAGAQAFILAFRGDGLAELEDIIINPYSRESETNWVREVEIQVSDTYPFRGFRPAGRWTLTAEGTDQVFSFERPTTARYLKVLFLGNGGGGYMQAGELRAMGHLVVGAPATPKFSALHETATLESFTSEYNDSDWTAANLLAPDAVAGQWSGKSQAAQEVVVALSRPATVTDVALSNYSRESDANWVRQAEVLVSADSPYKGFISVGTLEMPAVADLHALSLSQPSAVRYLKLVFRSNGGGGYIQAGRIRIFEAVGAQAAPVPPKTIADQLESSGRAVTQEIHFAFNSAEILPDSEPVLDEIAALLARLPDLELIIEGHTDGVGGAEFNLDLSRKRADAVKFWLVDRHGISELRLATVGYGAGRSVADNASEEGRARNRRVELVRRD